MTCLSPPRYLKEHVTPWEKMLGNRLDGRSLRLSLCYLLYMPCMDDNMYIVSLSPTDQIDSTVQDNRERHQPLQRTPKQTHIKIDRQRATETIRRHIHHIKEPAAAGIQDTITQRLGHISERSNQQGLVSFSTL
jgi:hypothetical protein